MLNRLAAVLLAGGAIVAQPAWAANYTFDVLYSGFGNATLEAGSDDPVGTTLWDGDSFDWTITAQGLASWTVVTGGGFFPLQAFTTYEAGTRTGDFTLTLSNDGAPVYTTSETGAVNNYVHIGTNTINLTSGLVFDQMQLHYTLTTAIEAEEHAVDPDNLQPIGSTLGGLLPIFGAPEANIYSPGIIYGPVP